MLISSLSVLGNALKHL